MTQFSFIIPYYEENQRINDQIKSILSLNVEFEIIVFDERHNPANAPELIHEEKSRYIKRAHRNRAALFNDGYAEAKGIYLVVLPFRYRVNSRKLEYGKRRFNK